VPRYSAIKESDPHEVHIDPVVVDYFANTKGRHNVNIGTIPRWMFKVSDIVLPGDPAVSDYAYTKDTTGDLLNDPTGKQFGEYPVHPLVRSVIAIRKIDPNVQLVGDGQGLRGLAAIAIGTGMGCGLVINGRISHGALNAAGEFGHQIVEPGGNRCSCGRLERPFVCRYEIL
jgi:hypothetical protein